MAKVSLYYNTLQYKNIYNNLGIQEYAGAFLTSIILGKNCQPIHVNKDEKRINALNEVIILILYAKMINNLLCSLMMFILQEYEENI